MQLTELEALRAYATMMNNLSIKAFEPLLAEDFVYEAQTVFSSLNSKEAFLEYIRRKLKAIESAGAHVFAEIGSISAYGRQQPCVILAQHHKDNLVGVVLARIHDDKLVRLDLCIVPPPESAKRSGEYPK